MRGRPRKQQSVLKRRRELRKGNACKMRSAGEHYSVLMFVYAVSVLLLTVLSALAYSDDLV